MSLPPQQSHQSLNGSSTKTLPREGLKLRTQILYDDAFEERFPGKVRETLDSILVHANSFFSHGSLQTKLHLDILPPEKLKSKGHHSATQANLETLKSMIEEPGMPEADAYVLLSSQGDEAGTLGVSYSASTCNTISRGFKSSIAEYFHDEILTAQARNILTDILV